MNVATSKFVRQLETMFDRLTSLYQEISSQPSPALLSSVMKELGIASERLQIAAKLLQQYSEQLSLAGQATVAVQQCYQELLEFIPDACLCTDVNGNIQAANQAASNLLNLSPSLLKMRSLTSFVALDQCPSFEADLQHLQQQPWKQEWHLSIQPDKIPPIGIKALVEVSHTEKLILRWLLRPLSQHQIVSTKLPGHDAQLDYPSKLYHKGEMIPFEPETIWQVQTGMVKLTTFLVNGQEAVIGLAGAAAPFGASLTVLPLYEATALVDTRLWRIPIAEFATSIQLQRRLLPQINQRLKQAELLLAMHGQPRVLDRLYNLLQMLKQEIGQPVPEGTRLSIRLTHEELAATCCTTRVTITRLMSQLQQQGKLIVDMKYHLILKE